MEDKIRVEITNEENAAVVDFRTASLSDSEGIVSVSKRIKEYVENNHPKKVIFDFGNVKFFSSQVLGLLLEIRAKLKPYNGEVMISQINPQLHRVFKITNLDRVFRFFPDKQSAVEAASAG